MSRPTVEMIVIGILLLWSVCNYLVANQEGWIVFYPITTGAFIQIFIHFFVWLSLS